MPKYLQGLRLRAKPLSFPAHIQLDLRSRNSLPMRFLSCGFLGFKDIRDILTLHGPTDGREAIVIALTIHMDCIDSSDDGKEASYYGASVIPSVRCGEYRNPPTSLPISDEKILRVICVSVQPHNLGDVHGDLLTVYIVSRHMNP